jgi:hypothetical protein
MDANEWMQHIKLAAKVGPKKAAELDRKIKAALDEMEATGTLPPPGETATVYVEGIGDCVLKPEYTPEEVAKWKLAQKLREKWGDADPGAAIQQAIADFEADYEKREGKKLPEHAKADVSVNKEGRGEITIEFSLDGVKLAEVSLPKKSD